MILLGFVIWKNDYEQVIKICELGIEVILDVLEFYFYLVIVYNQVEYWDDVLEVSWKVLEYVILESDK